MGSRGSSRSGPERCSLVFASGSCLTRRRFPSARLTTSKRSRPRCTDKEAGLFSLQGKRALVTGASGGIGGAIAAALHSQGATVTLSGTRLDALQDLAGRLAERTHIAAADLGDPTSVEALVPEAERLMGGLDILVNNAGADEGRPGGAHEGRGLADGPSGQSGGGVQALARRAEGHDAAAFRTDHRHHVGGRGDRQCRAGELRRVEGRH